MNCAKFIAESFALRTATHLAHLSTKSYAQHIALDEFYTGLLDLVDKYAEVYMGLEGQTPLSRWPEVCPDPKEPITLLEDYLVLLKEEFEEDAEHQSLINILAEIEELTARTLYKLRNLK